MFDMDEIIRENEYLRIENRKLRENKNELFTALSKAQGEFEVVTKNQKNPFFNSKYLTLELKNAFTFYEVTEAFDGKSVGDHVSIDEYNNL